MSEYTVIMTTSPLPVHPSTDVVEQAVVSVRDQLPDARILVMADGVRPEQERSHGDIYRGYLSDLGVLVHLYDAEVHASEEWVHQANLVRWALELTDTPCVLFCEHDCTLHGEIPWDGLSALLQKDVARFVRISLSEIVSPYYEHLVVAGPRPIYWDNDQPPVRMLKTRQFSTWPHVARTNVYRNVMDRYFDPSCRTLIEGVMWPTVHNLPWDQFKLWMYAPEGDMSRCTHHYEARGGDPMYPFKFAYPGGVTPQGAPAP